MATLSFNVSSYLFGCRGCGQLILKESKIPPVCLDPDCEYLGENMMSWHEIIQRVDGEGWKNDK